MDGSKMTEPHFSDVVAVARLAQRMSFKLEEAISAAITERLGVGWSLSDLAGRMAEVITPDGWSDFQLDGASLFRSGPIEVESTGREITAHRKIESATAHGAREIH